MTRFAGRTVFITGAAHGIGLATATAFAAEGADVFLYDRDAAQLEAAVAAVAAVGARGPGSVAGQVGDVRSRTELEAALLRCSRSVGEVDVLVANAGYSRSRHSLSLPGEEWDEIVGVCLSGVFRTAQTVARAMVTRGAGGCHPHGVRDVRARLRAGPVVLCGSQGRRAGAHSDDGERARAARHPGLHRAPG